MLKLFPEYSASLTAAGPRGTGLPCTLPAAAGAAPRGARLQALRGSGHLRTAARRRAGPGSHWRGALCTTFCGLSAGKEGGGSFRARFPLALATGSVSFPSYLVARQLATGRHRIKKSQTCGALQRDAERRAVRGSGVSCRFPRLSLAIAQRLFFHLQIFVGRGFGHNSFSDAAYPNGTAPGPFISFYH